MYDVRISGYNREISGLALCRANMVYANNKGLEYVRDILMLIGRYVKRLNCFKKYCTYSSHFVFHAFPFKHSKHE